MARRPAAVALLTLAAAGGCARPAPEPPVAPPAAPPAPARVGTPAVFVVADGDVELCRRPGEGCLARVEALDRPAIFQLLADRGEWLEVTTVDDWDVRNHCEAASSAVLEQPGMRLSFFLRRSALRQVTAKTALEWPNGTGVALRAGIAAAATDQRDADGVALYRLDAAGFELLLPLPASALAQRYEASKAVPVSDEPQRRSVIADRPLRFGLPLPSPVVEPRDAWGKARALAPGVILDPAHATDIYAEQPTDGGVLVELHSRCGAFRVVVAPGDVVATSTLGVHGMRNPHFASSFPRYSHAGRWRIRRGAPLYWDDGARAGEVGFFSAPLDGADSASGGRRCFERSLAPSWRLARGDASEEEAARGRFRVCADAVDLSLWPRHWSEAQAARIDATTRRYLSLEVVNNSAEPSDEIAAHVRGALADAFLLLGDWAMAPPGESAAAARARAEARKLAPYHLRFTVEAVTLEERPAQVFAGTVFPASLSARHAIAGVIVKPDGSEEPFHGIIGSSFGADDIDGGKPRPRALRRVVEHNIDNAAASLRSKIAAVPGPSPYDSPMAVDAVYLPVGWTRGP